MYSDHSHTADKRPKAEYRLADYFNAWWDKYVISPKRFIRPEQYKAVNAIRLCRTPALGVDVYACPECGEISEVYYSCKNRFCPTCSWKDTMKWAENVKLRMLNIPHRHIVCTLPHSLTGIIKQNQYELLGVLMRTAAETFKDYLLNKYNINIGIISVLHTFGEVKNFHAHVHMIVSWGGIRPKYRNLKIIEKQYVNYKFLQKKFRCKFEDELIAMYDKGELENEFINRQEFMRFVKEVNQNDWVIHLEPPIDTPEEVIRYIGRYSKRACLSEYKITNIDGENISFKYKDNKDRDENNVPKEKVLKLHYNDFFPRLLQHVPLSNFRLVRYYGIYSNKGSIPQEYFCKKEIETEEIIENPKECKQCGIIKQYIYTIFDTRGIKERYTPFNIDLHKHLITDRYHKQFAA